jgi:hypothetical protein
VRVVLRKLGLDPDQPYGELAIARIKGVARRLGVFDHDGMVDEEIARALGEAATAEAGLMPEWFHSSEVTRVQSWPALLGCLG